jgi:hypothetical protein
MSHGGQQTRPRENLDLTGKIRFSRESPEPAGGGSRVIANRNNSTFSPNNAMPYRTIIAALLMAPLCASGQQEWKIQTDVVIYEAIVAGTTIKVVVSNSWGQVIHSFGDRLFTPPAEAPESTSSGPGVF